MLSSFLGEYYYSPDGYDYLPHCGGKRKFSDVKDYSLYIILTYKSKPSETTTTKEFTSFITPPLQAYRT